MKDFIAAFRDDESGATAIEYGLIVALISVVLVAVLILLGSRIGATFDTLSATIVPADEG